MEVSLVISLWQLITALVTISGMFAVNTYMTKKNTKEIETIKEKDLVSWGDARNTFVSKEVNAEQIKHIDGSINEIKGYQKQILELLTNK